MKRVECFLKARTKAYDAKAIFENGKIVVLAGSRISRTVSANLKLAKDVKRYREDREYVDSNYILIKDVTFSSVSTAAQFVNGRSTNGFVAWKTKEGKTIKEAFAE